ncbi:pollen-specific leucine-rich repeat extensin-like protein 1 [Tanacetum coccineum]
MPDLSPVKSPAKWAPHEWYDFPDQPIVGLRRHRSTSSYPDLRELVDHRAEPPYRFSDDTHLRYDRYYFREDQDLGVKEDVFLDTVVENKEDTFAAPPQPPVVQEEIVAPQPPSPPPLPVRKSVRTYHSVAKTEVEKVGILEKREEKKSPENEEKLPENMDSGHRERVVRKKGKGERRRARSSEPRKMVMENDDMAAEPSSPVAVAAMDVLPEIQEFEQKIRKLERKKSGSATKEFFTSFYLKKKKKRQRHKSVDNLDTFLTHPQPAAVNFHLPPPSPPPPPPPLPPPPSVFNNLFTSKKERRKKVASTTPPPAPPPLPPKRTATRAPKPMTTTTRVSPFVTEKPRKPVKMSFFNGIDDSSSGGESPMSRIPPPPPMPPFKMPDWKFPVEGDYVRVQSTLSSECGSPDRDESQSPLSAMASPGSAFCPSPDVDTKADTFIARFRAGLKLEKINSFNQNQSSRMSNLGPGPGPSQSNRF